MFNTSVLEKLLNLQPTYLEQSKKYTFKRFLFPKLLKEINSKHITGISGLRGSGKTVLLLQLLNHLPSSFYLSLDFLPDQNLFELAQTLVKNYQIKYLLLDEVHYHPNWAVELKQIYDLLDVKVFFSSSVSLDILNTQADLARRVQVLNLPVLSFREFLIIKHQLKTPIIPLDQLLKTNWQTADISLESYFLDYLHFPLASQIQDPTPTLIKNIVTKIIHDDLTTIKNLTLKDRMLLAQTLKFLASIPGGDISLTALAQNMKVNYYKMSFLIELLEKAFLIHRVFPLGKNVLKEPKILFNLPFRVYLQPTENKQLGSLKEDFLITMTKSLGISAYYLKTKRGRKTPDFYLELPQGKIIIEVGGKKKGFSQFKNIDQGVMKKIATYPFQPKPNAIPLYLFGLTY